MNNKKIGDEFENEFCNLLSKEGYWVHFITPDKRGAQPFDVIAAKDGQAFAFDCKTSALKWFGMSRLEDNQVYAFERWLDRGNHMPHIAIKYNEKIYMIPYLVLKMASNGRINLEDYEVYCWERYKGRESDG